jgi:hypothetical protein
VGSRREKGEDHGGEYFQNTLYICMKIV